MRLFICKLKFPACCKLQLSVYPQKLPIDGYHLCSSNIATGIRGLENIDTESIFNCPSRFTIDIKEEDLFKDGGTLCHR
jgi:hypothetical protein